MNGDLDAAEIMRLRVSEAALLFPGDADMVARRYRRLARLWHPDHNPAPEAAGVFAHVAELHAAACRALKPPAPKEQLFHTRDGRSFRFAWLTRHVTDCGELMVGNRHVVHIVSAEAGDLARSAAGRTFPFAHDAMRGQFEPLLPRRVALLETDQGTVFVHAKSPDQVLLADLMKLGPVEPRHAAWMTTRLMNLACYLQYAGIVHGAIDRHCVLVSPRHHKVSLTGPLLCAGLMNGRPGALPERTLAELPRLEAPDAVCDGGVDPALVRLTIREALGDPAGTRLAGDPTFPNPFALWLLMPGADNAQADFRAWEQARDAAFGPRRFIQWDFDPAALLAA
jgi:hypothetical protein